MKKRDTMPASVFWSPVGGAVAVVSLVMLVMVSLVADGERTAREAINNRVWFQQALFQYIAGTSEEKADDPTVALIAAYLREHREQLDDILERERLISSSMSKEQRTALYVQSPERFPKQMLLMTNEPRWRALRDDATALDTLKKLLLGEISAAPDAQYDTRSVSVLPAGLLIALPFVCQLFPFLVYLACWGGEESGAYRWYEFRWPVRMSMVLLLPGAAPVLIPMALWAIGRQIKQQWGDASGRGARKNIVLPGANSLRNSTDFLKKLQQRAERRKETEGGRVLRK